MTTNALMIENQAASDLAEQAAVAGDLSQLTAAQRMAYYSRVCESLGINPFTQPFQYIRLNNKLVLYATRSAADQLRRRNQVSLDAPRIEFADGLCIVTVTGRDATGRMDTEIGAVPLGNLQGEARANAIMKAVTKAKRRLTLSICGLGWLDETEVETIRDARPVTVTAEGEIVDEPPALQSGIMPVAPVAPFIPPPDDEIVIFEGLAAEFVATAANQLHTDTQTLKDRMKALGYTGIPGKPDERVAAYRKLKSDLGDNVQTELFGELPAEPVKFIDPA